MHFRVLGPLEVDAGVGPIHLGGPKQRSLLANLLVRANQVVPAAMLIDEVWGEEHLENARNTLQTHVSSLRKAVGAGRLQGRSPGYVLIVAPDELDLTRFEELVREAKRTMPVDPNLAVSTLDTALALWRGPALADVADQPSLVPEAARLEELRLDAQQARIEGLLASGARTSAVGELEALVARHPLRESLWGLLMLAFYREGRQAETLDAFRRARETLSEELGIDPSPELIRLHERVLQQDPSLELRGEPLRGYRLLEKIGEGSAGVVFRAIQPHVERDVAVKIFHRRIADDPDLVQRFEPEAHAVAALEHPHIVPVYDYWREPGGAYLVARYLRGGSLRTLEERGEVLEPSHAARVVEQVSSALAFAHRQGVAHGCVSTSNVLFDAEGNAYLGDFRIGTGVRPEPTDDVRDLDALARALLGDRLSLALADARGNGALPPPSAADLRNPYKGLRPFTEPDALDFFGRTLFTQRLIERLKERDRGSRFVAVVGPSGCGKSSVVRAGLVPAIWRGELGDPGTWFVADMFPGAHPIDELEAALLRVALRPASRLHDLLDGGSRGLLEAVDLIVPPGAEVLLVVDQFEEAFTLTSDERERELFLESLRVATADPESRLRVVVTLRADFYDRPLAVPRFGELLAVRNEAVPPLTPDELEQAIRMPAERLGVRPEQGLVAEMIAEVAHQPGALPLLQYALTELFEARDDSRMTLSAYRELGGAAGALSARADRLFEAADPLGGRAIRQVFLRLVTLGEGRQDTRRRVARSELDALEVDPAAIDVVLDAYGRHRLLTFDREPATREPTVEIAHEALLGTWGRLQAWIDEAREDLRQDRRLARAASEWRAADRDPSFLMGGARLDQVESWSASTSLAIGRSERAYLKASVDERDRERGEEERRREHEAQVERRSLRRLRGLVAMFAVAAIIAGSLTIVATKQRERASHEARISQARELAATANAQLDVDTERGVLLAIEAVELTRAGDGTVPREAEEALHRVVGASRLELSLPGRGGDIDWSSTGVFVTTGTFASEGPRVGVIDIRDAETGAIVRSFPGHEGALTGVAFSSDGSVLATTGKDGTLKVWDPSTGDLLTSVLGRFEAFGPSFSGDGSLVAALWGRYGEDPERTLRVVDLTTGLVLTFRFAWESIDTALSPDGRRIAVGTGFAPGMMRVIDLETREVVRLEGRSEFGFSSVSWSPDGRYVAGGGWDDTPEVWDAATGRLLFSLAGHTDGAYHIDWSRDSSHLVTGAQDATARVWEIADEGPRGVAILAAPEGTISGVAFSPDGTRVMTGSDASAVKVWDVGPTGDAEWAILPATHDVVFMGAGREVLATGVDGSLTVWDLATGQDDPITAGSLGPTADETVQGSDVSPDGRAVAIRYGGDQSYKGGVAGSWTYSVRDVATGEELFAIDDVGVQGDDVSFVEWSPDGEYLAARPVSGSTTVFDRAGNEVGVLPDAGLEVSGWEFSPDGRLIATTDDDRLRIWDWRQGEVVATFPAGETEAIAFDPTGTRLATAQAIWDVESGRVLVRLPSLPADIQSLAFSPDGARLAVGSADNLVRLFDAESGEELLLLEGHHGAVVDLDFSPDGSMLASVSEDDGMARVWALHIDDLLEIARGEVTRSLTVEECRRYLHVDPCQNG